MYGHVATSKHALNAHRTLAQSFSQTSGHVPCSTGSLQIEESYSEAVNLPKNVRQVDLSMKN
jgi:hypothetical protein